MQNKIKFALALIKISLIISTFLILIFSISIPISASRIKIETPNVENETKIIFEKNNVIIESKFKIINLGFYDLKKVSIEVSLFTLEGYLITRTYQGFPYEDIQIISKSVYEGKIRIKINLNEIVNLGIAEKIIKDKAIKILISASGSYAFDFFKFNVKHERIINFTPPIEKIEINFNVKDILFPKEIVVKDEILEITFPVKLNLKGWITLENLTLTGNIYREKENIIQFKSEIQYLNPGENLIFVKAFLTKETLIYLFSKEQSLKIDFIIKKENFEIKRETIYEWKNPLEILIYNLEIEKIDSLVSMKASFFIKNNSEIFLEIKGKLKVYDHLKNVLIVEKIIEIKIKENEILFKEIEVLSNEIDHGSVLRFELYIEEPIKIKEFPLFKEILILP